METSAKSQKPKVPTFVPRNNKNMKMTVLFTVIFRVMRIMYLVGEAARELTLFLLQFRASETQKKEWILHFQDLLNKTMVLVFFSE